MKATMYLDEHTTAYLKLDIFRAILVSQGGSPQAGNAASITNNVFDTLYGGITTPKAKRGKKR